jgi:L-lactate dehydrogenase complex protein LldG
LEKSEHSGRERILERIRSALSKPAPLRTGKTEVVAPVINDPLLRFQAECATNKTECIVASDAVASAAALANVLSSVPPGDIFVQESPLLRRLETALGHRHGIRWSGDGPPDEAVQATVTLAELLVAATGSVLVSAACGGRRASIIAPVHIVVATMNQLAPMLDTAFALIRERGIANRNSALSLITGPSRTGDIEKILVMGAHGPRRLVVVLAANFQ